MSNKFKVIVIGLDGACWDIIRDLMKKCRFRAFSLFLEKGIHGILETVIPPSTMPAWKCYSTGLPPEKLNAFHWYIFDPASRKIRISNLNNDKKEIWDYLSEHGLKCVVINTPLVHRKKINGILVAGPPVSSEKGFVYPKKYEKLIKTLFKYRVNMNYTLGSGALLPEDAKRISRLLATIEIARLIRSRFKLAKYLWKKISPDFMQLTIFYIDHAQHYLANDSNEKLLIRIWKLLDTLLYDFIIEILRHEKNVIFILMSDHGHTKVKYTFLINNWLYKMGFLKLKLTSEIKYTFKLLLFSFVKRYDFIKRFLLKKLGIFFFCKRTKTRIAGISVRKKKKLRKNYSISLENFLEQNSLNYE